MQSMRFRTGQYIILLSRPKTPRLHARSSFYEFGVWRLMVMLQRTNFNLGLFHKISTSCIYLHTSVIQGKTRQDKTSIVWALVT